MAKRGRSRKDRARQPNGRVRELPAEAPAAAHLRALGVNPEDRRIHCIVEARRIAAGADPRDQIASTPLGMMHAIGLVDRRRYQAGLLYEANQIRIGRAIAGPHQTRSVLACFMVEASAAVYAGIDDDNFKKAFYRCRWVEREIAARVSDWRLLDRIVVKQEMPSLAMLADPEHPDLKTFKADLAAIAHFYERPPRFDDSRHPLDRSGMMPGRLREKLAAR